MSKISIFYAKSHLYELLKRVKRGEKIILVNGKDPIARLLPVKSKKKRNQKAAKIDLSKIVHPEATFIPISEVEMQELGLL